MRIATPVADGGTCGEPIPLQQAQELDAGFRLLGQRREEIGAPGL
jgi:hypothetical protein